MTEKPFDPAAILADIERRQADLNARLLKLRPMMLGTFVEVMARQLRGERKRGDVKKLKDARYILRLTGGVPELQTAIAEWEQERAASKATEPHQSETSQ